MQQLIPSKRRESISHHIRNTPKIYGTAAFIPADPPIGNINGIRSKLLPRLRQIEEGIFQDSSEIFVLINQGKELRVDGRTYAQIAASPVLSAELNRIRRNTPIYQHWSARKKSKYMQELGEDYKRRLRKSSKRGKRFQRVKPQNIAGSISVQSDQQKDGNNSVRHNGQYILKLDEKCVEETMSLFAETSAPMNPKKVSFSDQSSCKYFSSVQASWQLTRGATYSFSTS